MKRLPPVAGEWIDRDAPVTFRFEGREFVGFAGDTISSALLANGVRTLGRSFKYHRRRGVLSAADHDVNVVVQMSVGARSAPNVRADVTPIVAGASYRGVNTQGGIEGDGRAWVDRVGSFLPAGFYYKAFHGKRLFPRWERMFRDLTGLGTVDVGAPRTRTPKRYAFADVVVIGGGASGLAAAIAAAECGADVVLVDENPRLGGSATFASRSEPAAMERLGELLDRAATLPNLRAFTSTVAAGYYADHWLALETRDCLVKLRARAVVVAQGAFEQPAVFRNNDLPGVMLASAAQRLLHRFAVAPATRIAVLTANADGYRAALDARRAGIDVAAVLDLRAQPGPISQPLERELRQAGVRVETGHAIVAADAGRDGSVARIAFGTWNERDASIAASGTLDVDGVWMSVGYAPANALLQQAGAKLRYERSLEQFVPAALPPGLFACGRVSGRYEFEARVLDGTQTGLDAARHCGASVAARMASSPTREAESPSHPYPIVAHAKAREFVDFDEDLQIKDVATAIQEGFDSPELLKRFTTMGMGPSQGKHSNLNALRILARLRGLSMDQLAGTTARPFFHPVPMAKLAGRGFAPERRTPIDAEHERLGAVWMPAGNWRRPEYYRVNGRTREASIAAEVRAVRTGVALIDVGTLGKIEAHGPRAAEFLERVYTSRYANLPVGMTRYALMLDESGVVMDDGVVARLAPEAFYFTTTTGNSATIFRELGRLATLWGVPVGLVNLTGHLAAFNLAGPRAREVLAQLTSLDLSPATFPYLGVREANVAGVPAKVMRVGFVGELGYEIHVPFNAGLAVWQALMQAGAPAGIVPFGVEAQRMLRLEKAHVIVRQDTDGLTNPLEIGAEWALKMDKPFFVGQRSLRILAQQARRQVLVGFRFRGEAPVIKESHLVIDHGEIAGRVTSVGRSPTLGCVIGLAFVAPALAEAKEFKVRVDAGVLVTVERASLPFYDRAGERQRVEIRAAARATESAA